MAIILTIIAGFSTFLGSLIIFIKKQNNKILTIALSFSATIMIGISLLDLIYENHINIDKEKVDIDGSLCTAEDKLLWMFMLVKLKLMI